MYFCKFSQLLVKLERGPMYIVIIDNESQCMIDQCMGNHLSLKASVWGAIYRNFIIQFMVVHAYAR